MSMPKDEIHKEMVAAWAEYVKALERSLDLIDKSINEAKEMAGICTREWCNATEHVLDDLGNMLFSISEPRWSSDVHSKRLKSLKHRLHDIYANYRSDYQKAA